MKARQGLCLALCLSALLFAGCGTSIKKVQDNKNRYLADSSITLKGQVTRGIRVPTLKPVVFEIDDGTGKMFVMNMNGEMPEKGRTKKVTGTLKENYQFARQTFPLVLVEQ